MNKIKIKEILKEIRNSKSDRETIIVGIDGCGGAGKSTLAERIAQLASDIKVIQMDDFYLPSKYRSESSNEVGGSFDIERIEKQVLAPLSKDLDAIFQKYNWEDDVLDKEIYKLSKGGIVLIEGVYSTIKELSKYYDYKIWIDTSKETRLQRGVERDGEKAREIWENEWMPSEEAYIIAETPFETSDLVISGENSNLYNDVIVIKGKNE